MSARETARQLFDAWNNRDWDTIRNALHPEFFGIEGRHRIEHGEYEFEAWIFRGGHALRFEHDGATLAVQAARSMRQLLLARFGV